MSERFRELYQIGTSRYPGHDYSSPGIYFVTICTRKKIPYFGEIINSKMFLSGTGIIVRDFWFEIPNHFPNAKLDEFVIMPDHLHGIVIIVSKSATKSIIKNPDLSVIFNGTTPNFYNVETPKFNNVETPNFNIVETPKFNIVETPNLGVSTHSIDQKKKPGNPNWKSNSLGLMINQFKRICTIKTKIHGLDLVWQSRFYDHIIRSNNELKRIRIYIKNNPKEFHG